MDECIVCAFEVTEELACKLCSRLIHYQCALGSPINNPKFGSTLRKNYTCPVCIVSTNNELVLQCITANQRHIKVSNSNDPQPESGDEAEADTLAVPNRVNFISMLGKSLARQQSSRTEPQPCEPSSPSAHLPREPSSPSAGSTPLGYAPLHKYCEARAKDLSYILRSLQRNLPNNASTLIIGDSLTKCLNKKELDPGTDSVRIRSVGGLCVFATVQALRRHESALPFVKKVVYSLGINDHLHRDRHCHENTEDYFKDLQNESLRIFPHAKVCVVLPYKGMVGHDITDMVQRDLVKVLQSKCPKLWRFTPPTLTGKVAQRGIHPNLEGKKVLTKFYRDKFVEKPNRVFSRSSGRNSKAGSYARAHIPAPVNTPHHAPVNFRVPQQVNDYNLQVSTGGNQSAGVSSQGGDDISKDIYQAVHQAFQRWAPPPTNHGQWRGNPY